MWPLHLFVVLTWSAFVLCEDRVAKIVNSPQGPVKGYKDPGDDVFIFYGIPYATAPTGQHKFKAPLPEPTFLSEFEAVNKDIVCPQIRNNIMVNNSSTFREDCLVANVFLPDTTETNLSVVVYVHGGAFQIGHGNFFTPKNFLKSKKVIMVTFNYRLGIHGFLCLGTENVPGNAGMKDQIALLRWVKKNIASYGGNPEDVTIAGYSAGSASVDLLMLSPSAKGLFNKIIPESGANIAAFTVQIDPIENAKIFARRYITDVDDVYVLEDFYRKVSFDTLSSDAFWDRKDSSFLFSPCVERETSAEEFLTDSPYNILRSGNYVRLPMLYGFANMEGLLRIDLFDTWKKGMNEKFSDFLPPDLEFANENEREYTAAKIKKFYFGDKEVSEDTILGYVDYFSDVIFIYPTIRAVNLQVSAGNNEIYLYEYSFFDDNTPEVPHTNVRGANHCGQTLALFDGNKICNTSEDSISEEFKQISATVRELWTNFITTGKPVPEGSSLPAWPPTGANGSPHMSLGRELKLRTTLLEDRMRLWDQVYEKYYRAPTPPPAPPVKHSEL